MKTAIEQYQITGGSFEGFNGSCQYHRVTYLCCFSQMFERYDRSSVDPAWQRYEQQTKTGVTEFHKKRSFDRKLQKYNVRKVFAIFNLLSA